MDHDGKKGEMIFMDKVEIDKYSPLHKTGHISKGDQRKWKIENLWILTQIPVISFAAGQTRAVNSGLLSCTDTDGLSAFSKTDRIGLGIF